MDTKTLKAAMVAYMKKHGLDVDPMIMDADVWGEAAKKNAWRISTHAGWKPSTAKTQRLINLVASYAPKPPAPLFPIHHDYHAVHSSGTRALSQVHLVVLHDMEVTAYNTAAEAVGRYFEMAASGGSTNYGVDNDSIQQYLGLEVIPWGAPYANTQGVHIEQMGVASWTGDQWRTKAKGTLQRTAWLSAHLSKVLGIPLRKLNDAQVRANVKGVTTHAQCTRVFGGSHTDPGPGYPIDYVLGLARGYAAKGV